MYKKSTLFFNELLEENSKYTTKCSIPQYSPIGVCPSIYELCGLKKYEELLDNINSSSISQDEKEFLKLAATRHIVFNYAKIAEYYCHASKDMQQLMEESALVLIDLNNAIANGYVNLDKKITALAQNAFIERKEKENINNEN